MSRQKLAAAGALAAVLAGSGASGAADSGRPSDARVTSAAFVTNGRDEVPGHSYTSPSVVVDPDDPRLVYAAAVEIRTESCVLLRSSDGGRTWTRGKASPAPAAFPMCTHDNGLVPMSFLAMGRDKTLYFLHIGWDAQDGGRSENRSVFVGRTRDGGDTWESTPVNVNRGKTGNDIEKNVPTDLVVDTKRGEQDVVVASYTASYPNPSTPPTRPGQPFVAASTDGGRTFGTPVNVATSYYDNPANLPADIPEEAKKRENFGGSGSNLAVDGKGTLFVTWNRSSANITPSPPTVTHVARSGDAGRTWTSSVLHPGHPDQTGPGGVQFTWSPAGGNNGSLHAVWEGRLTAFQGDRDVIYRRSLDEGRTWSEPRLLNDDDPRQYFPQYQPNIAVAPNGRLEVVWWDFRDASGLIATDVFGTTSSDAGATWTKNMKVTDRLINRRIGVWKPGFGGDVRQPPGVGAADELSVVVWDDTRNGNEQTETADLYAATMQYEALPRSGGLPKGAGYALAAALGVVGVGVLMVLVAGAVRGRRVPKPAATAPGREPAGVS